MDGLNKPAKEKNSVYHEVSGKLHELNNNDTLDKHKRMLLKTLIYHCQCRIAVKFTLSASLTTFCPSSPRMRS